MTGLTTSETAAALDALTIGERAWFWLCPQAEPRLLASAMGDDRDMARIRAAARAVCPEGAAWISGVMSVDQEGRFNLYSQSDLAGAPMLESLADWASAHHQEHPGLAALRGARLLRIDGEGHIQADAEQPSAWSELPHRVVPGSIAHAARRIRALADGEQYILWMTARPAHLIVARSPVDFKPQLDAFCRRNSEVQPPVQGLLRRQDGTLGICSQAAPSEIAAILPGILRLDPELAPLARAWQIQLGEDGEVGQVQAPAADMLADRLVALYPGDKALFWFHPQVGLDIDTDKDALQQRTEAHGGGARGRLQVHSDGWIEIQIARAAPGFLAALIGWVGENIQARPGLARLRRARVSIRDRSGATIERQRDDHAWSSC